MPWPGGTASSLCTKVGFQQPPDGVDIKKYKDRERQAADGIAFSTLFYYTVSKDIVRVSSLFLFCVSCIVVFLLPGNWVVSFLRKAGKL